MLHLDSAANRSEESISRELTALFASTWRSSHSCGGYRYRDLAADPVPPLTTAYCTLGRRVERTGRVSPADVTTLIETAAEEREWELTHPLIAEVLAADIVLIGAPMYNYSVPAALKAWIDRISFPGAFIDPASGKSLLRDTAVVVISPRGGAYGPGSPRAGLDFHTPYLRGYFQHHGVAADNLHFINAEMTVAGFVPHLARYRPQAADTLAAARAEVAALATDAAMSVTGLNVTANWRCAGEAARVVP